MTGRGYAEGTTVDAAASRAEIERTVARFGASGFMYGWQDNVAVIGFVAHGRQIRFTLPLPDRRDFPDRRAGNGRTVSGEKEWEQAVKERWRALAASVKARFAAVDAEILTFEEEFAMFTVLPDGRTAAEHVLPRIQVALESGGVPDLLPKALGAGPSA